jgi:hypothetical protein
MNGAPAVRGFAFAVAVSFGIEIVDAHGPPLNETLKWLSETISTRATNGGSERCRSGAVFAGPCSWRYKGHQHTWLTWPWYAFGGVTGWLLPICLAILIVAIPLITIRSLKIYGPWVQQVTQNIDYLSAEARHMLRGFFKNVVILGPSPKVEMSLMMLDGEHITRRDDYWSRSASSLRTDKHSERLLVGYIRKGKIRRERMWIPMSAHMFTHVSCWGGSTIFPLQCDSKTTVIHMSLLVHKSTSVKGCGEDKSPLNLNQRITGNLCARASRPGAVGDLWSLLADFPIRQTGDNSKSKSNTDANCLNPALIPSPPGITLAILGCIVFAYSCLGDRIGLDFGLKWPDGLLGGMCVGGLLLLMYGVYLLAERSEFRCQTTKSTPLSLSHACSGGRLIGGDLTTCLRSFSNFRYPGGFGGLGFSSSTLSFGFGSDITLPPDWSRFSNRDASRRPIRVLSGSAARPLTPARYSGMTAHQDI